VQHNGKQTVLFSFLGLGLLVVFDRVLPYIFLSSRVSLQFHALSTVKANFLVCSVCVVVSSFLGVRSTIQCGNVAVAVTVCVRSNVSLL